MNVERVLWKPAKDQNFMCDCVRTMFIGGSIINENVQYLQQITNHNHKRLLAPKIGGFQSINEAIKHY